MSGQAIALAMLGLGGVYLLTRQQAPAGGGGGGGPNIGSIVQSVVPAGGDAGGIPDLPAAPSDPPPALIPGIPPVEVPAVPPLEIIRNPVITLPAVIVNLLAPVTPAAGTMDTGGIPELIEGEGAGLGAVVVKVKDKVTEALSATGLAKRMELAEDSFGGGQVLTAVQKQAEAARAKAAELLNLRALAARMELAEDSFGGGQVLTAVQKQAEAATARVRELAGEGLGKRMELAGDMFDGGQVLAKVKETLTPGGFLGFTLNPLSGINKALGNVTVPGLFGPIRPFVAFPF